MRLEKKRFGFIGQKAIDEYTLTNSNHLSLSVITYGGIITKIEMPNRFNEVEEVTVNMEILEEIVKSRPFHGAIVGPVAGRISNASYLDEGRRMELTANENNNTLHSGLTGLDTQVWEATTEEKENEASLILTTVFPDGEGGFPGDIQVWVTYTLNEANEITIHYEADTNKRTLFNPTNHVYFNLSGNYKETIYTHDLEVDSSRYAVLNEENIPTGELKDVTGTAFDLHQKQKLKTVLASSEKEIAAREGLDHPFLLDQSPEKPALKLSHTESGRVLEMETDCDAVVIYTHNGPQLSATGADRTLEKHTGITVETQQLPDAVNQPGFGSIWLKPTERFDSTTTFKFSLMD